MYVLADSSSTRTEWVLVDGLEIVARTMTKGLNPYFLSRREISHCIRLDLPEEFFRRRWEHIYFYGAGCANPEKNKIIESSIVAQFRTPATINSDLLGAARGLFVHQRGLGCILGTGSNSCVYDGKEIKRNIKSGGYILGDEGSGCDIGKAFVNDCLKGLAPTELINSFYEKFSLTPEIIMDDIYTGEAPNRTLSWFSTFLIDYQEMQYVRELISDRFRSFFKRTVLQYDGYKELPLGFVGRNAISYETILREVAKEFGIIISKITDRSIPGLIEYHSLQVAE